MEHISTEQLLDYIDGRLAPQEHRRVEQHLGDCATCRAEVASLRQTMSMLAEDDWVMPPARVRASVQRAFRQQAADGGTRPSFLEWVGTLLAPRRGPALALALFLVILAVGLAYRVFQTPPPSQTVAASAVAGPAEVLSAGSEQWQPLQGGAALSEGDQVRTGSGGSVLLTFSDGSTTQVQGKSLLAVSGLQSDPRSVALEQRRGETRNRILPGAEAAAYFEISTPSALITTEGAEFDVIVDETEATRVTVTSGEVSIIAAGSSLTVGEGQEAAVQPGQEPQLLNQEEEPTPTPTATSTATATPSATPTASSTPTLAPPAPTPTATMEPPLPTEAPDDDTPEPTEEPEEEDTPEPTEEPDDDDDTPEPTEEPDDDDDTPEPDEDDTPEPGEDDTPEPSREPDDD